MGAIVISLHWAFASATGLPKPLGGLKGVRVYKDERCEGTEGSCGGIKQPRLGEETHCILGLKISNRCGVLLCSLYVHVCGWPS